MPSSSSSSSSVSTAWPRRRSGSRGCGTPRSSGRCGPSPRRPNWRAVGSTPMPITRSPSAGRRGARAAPDSRRDSSSKTRPERSWSAATSRAPPHPLSRSRRGLAAAVRAGRATGRPRRSRRCHGRDGRWSAPPTGPSARPTADRPAPTPCRGRARRGGVPGRRGSGCGPRYPWRHRRCGSHRGTPAARRTRCLRAAGVPSPILGTRTHRHGAPGWTRTAHAGLRTASLYPLSYGGALSQSARRFPAASVAALSRAGSWRTRCPVA
jgi:hypothetical protein